MPTTSIAIATMQVAQISKPGGDFEIRQREIPKPAGGQVRIKVQACGICHSDVLVKDGMWPGIQYPRIPEHEVVSIIEALGTGVSEWRIGQRVGVGWHGRQDGTCLYCQFGYKVAAIGRGSDNAALAEKLGANVYFDSNRTNTAEELQKLGGAQVILATAPSSKAMFPLEKAGKAYARMMSGDAKCRVVLTM